MDSIPEGSDRNVITCTKGDIFRIIKNHFKESGVKQIEILEAGLTEKMNRSILIHKDAEPSLHALWSKIKSRWQSSARHEKRFTKKYNDWLFSLVRIRIYDTDILSEKSNNRGRPSLEFSKLSDRSKRRRTEELRTFNTTEELAYATQMSLRASGQLQASKIVKDVTTNPIRVCKYLTALTSNNEITLSDDSALSMLIDLNFSQSIYLNLRKIGKETNCKMYPSYKKVLEAKERCYPLDTSITITESSAEVKLQALLDHTTERILLLKEKVIDILTKKDAKNMHLICKWGCDGSAGQSVYKQKFTEDGKSIENVFFISFVPLQLISKDPETKTETVVWKNPRPSSFRFCRPIKLQFLHENVESRISEVGDIEQQIELLVPFTTQVHGIEICVKYNMILTMIDNNVCNAISETKSTCYLCGATSKDFNNIDKILQKEIVESSTQFGISTLHVWIRFFECLLHLSYKLQIKKWQVSTEEEKTSTEECKRIIQKEFRLQMRLIVDRPKPGYGSINDGYTARGFFENWRTSATITGVSKDLIYRFYIILQSISSGFNVNCNKFREYALETARKFVELYPWYCMPISVHKLLIHGPEIIASALLPIGQLSESAQEARNKEIEKLRENPFRKCSRKETMHDVFNRLMVISDPYISSIRELPKKPLKSLSPEVIQLLESPKIHGASLMDSDSDSELSPDTDIESEIESDSDLDMF